ncbi:hypothetical protein [Pseudomonas protegens]|uniref:hypothetical protein n=1 Tax=Pseudomonas protegens TaxID=380021 RepID=UPI00069E65DE|nr:hypothetical protein [Pseudomonas protegens]
MTVKIAYLEISGRQTGKTTRLVKFANELTAQGKTVIFVTPLAKHVRGLLPGVVVLSDGENPPDEVDQDQAVWIYDEFDWLTSTRVRNGAYYATTAKRTRELGVDTPANDLLMLLLHLNGRHLQRHFWPFVWSAEDWFKEVRSCYSTEQYRAWFLGEFLK